MSKRLLLSTASIAILAATGLQVSAADLPVKAPMASAAAPLFTGWYVGGHLGYGWGRFDFNSFSSFPQHKGNGPVGGLQLGYNYRSGNIVWGLEGDASAANFTTGDGGYARTNVDFLASLRGRLGIVFDRVLVYGTAGGAYVHTKSASSTTPLHWNYGGTFRPVVGAGAEYAIRNDLSLRAEVLGYLGKHNFSAGDDIATVKNIWVGRVGFNYFFDGAHGSSSSAYPVKAAARPFTWAGYYLGGHLGYGWGRFDFSSFPVTPQTRGNGPVGGLHTGYNWQSGNIVWGLEGDMSAANFEAGDGNYVYADVNLLASLRGRLGIAFDRVLVYATAGGAYVHAKGAGSTTPLHWRYGNMYKPVVGGGIEYAYDNNLSFRTEVLGYLNKNTFTASSDDTATIKNIWVARFGVTYKFD